MRLLLVGFEPASNIQYPHLRQVADFLRAQGADYCLFRERGYFLGEPATGSPMRRLRRQLSTLLGFGNDCLRLLLQARHKYDAVVAVDNVAYLVAARLFPRVVLWSHDFLTTDEPRSRAPVQALIRRSVASALQRNHRLIIQDQDRLRLFRETYLEEADGSSVRAFLLPVSLMDVPQPPVRIEPSMPPRLMQIGGINSQRSRSDWLLDHYQRHSADYRLFLHGFISPEITAQLATAKVIPEVSARLTSADEVHRIVGQCDLGFIAYVPGNLNFFYVARASGQLAEFFRCGKPVITIGESSLGLLLETQRLGRRISTMDELLPAIDSILADYSGYSRRCRATYLESYELGRYLPELLDWLQAGEATGSS